MHNLSALAQSMGPFIIIPALFLVVGVSMWVTLVWGLVTGGPRAGNEPGAPYLYDRIYYMLFLLATIGWSVALLCFDSDELNDGAPAGFLVGWGILAIGMGALFVFRSDMMLRGSLYQAKHGFWLSRFFHSMQAAQMERQGSAIRKGVGGIFLLLGLGVTALNVQHIPDAFEGAWRGAIHLVHFLTG